jgi:hypothetical protein
MLSEIDATKERRPQSERMNRRADIVQVTGQRQFLCPGAAADQRVSLDHQNPASRACEVYRGSQAVGTRPDHHGVIVGHGMILAAKTLRQGDPDETGIHLRIATVSGRSGGRMAGSNRRRATTDVVNL